MPYKNYKKRLEYNKLWKRNNIPRKRNMKKQSVGMKEKICTKCGKLKSIDNFRKDLRKYKNPYFNTTRTKTFCIECENKRNKEYRETPKAIYLSLKRNIKNKGKVKISLSEFLDWYENVDKRCFYCGISEKDWAKCDDSLTKITKRLTIDKKNPKGLYEKDNMVFACFRCNIIKSDFFTPSEMKELAQQYVKPKRN